MAAPPAAPQPAELALLPEALRRALGSAVRELDMKQLEALLQRVAALDATLAQRLGGMLERHQYPQLWELLQSAVDLKEDA